MSNKMLSSEIDKTKMLFSKIDETTAKKEPEESVKSLIRRTGGINRCVTEEKKLREKKKRKASGTK